MSYDYSYGYETSSAIASEILMGLGIFYLIFLAVCIFLLVCMYKVFKKAGRNGWEAFIPIYNTIVMIQIAELPMWYIALFFVPFANIYAMFKIYIEFAHKFGKSTGFGIAMIFFSYICFPILAFGNAQYQGSIPMNTNYNPNPIPNNEIEQQNMQMNYNQNVTPNNYSGEVAGLNNSMNNFVQPQVQPAPVEMVETPTVNSTPEIQPIPTSPVEPVAEIQPTPVEPVVEVQPTSVTEPVVEPVFSESVMTEPIQNDKKFCPNCGNQVDQNDAICFMCGNKF